MILAQHFSAGKGDPLVGASPVGTAVPTPWTQPSLRDYMPADIRVPSDESLGYSQTVPTGRGLKDVGKDKA